MDDNKIGMNIKKYRKGKFTQQELADKIGKTESSIRKYEKGLVKIPLDVLNRIATALEVKVVDIIGISTYLDEVESDIKRTTSFYDYLGLLGYEIHESEHSDNLVMYVKESDAKIELSSKDIELLGKLESSTRETILSTIQLMIDAKNL